MNYEVVWNGTKATPYLGVYEAPVGVPESFFAPIAEVEADDPDLPRRNASDAWLVRHDVWKLLADPVTVRTICQTLGLKTLQVSRALTDLRKRKLVVIASREYRHGLRPAHRYQRARAVRHLPGWPSRGAR